MEYRDSEAKQILLEKYELLEMIGQGGTGRVYKAYDRHLHQTVAIKMITGNQGDTAFESLQNEADILKVLEHPALPRVWDYFREEEAVYLVLEHIQGITLGEYITRNGPLRPEQAVAMIKELGEVLMYLHSFKPPLIYRDIKPANIMLREDGRLKLVDFGTAFFCSFEGIPAIRAGTPGFSAPEQLWGRPGSDISREAADIYSFGAVLHFLLTGINPTVPPYERRPVREYNGAISRGIQQIIAKCIRENPKERYQNMYQVLQDLEGYKKLEQGRFIKSSIKNLIFGICMAAGTGLVLQEARQGIMLPFLLIDERIGFNQDFYLSTNMIKAGFVFAAGWLYRKWCFKGPVKRYLRRQEKNIWLTEKKSLGLWLCLLCIMTGTASSMGREAFAKEGGEAVEGSEEQAGQEGQIPVTVRNLAGQKLLIRYDAVYKPDEDIIFEIPLEGIPKGETMAIQLAAVGETGLEYKSRIFYVLIE